MAGKSQFTATATWQPNLDNLQPPLPKPLLQSVSQAYTLIYSLRDAVNQLSTEVGVTSISPGDLTGDVILAAGANISLSVKDQTITIAGSGGGGSQTPWVGDVDAACNSLKNVQNISSCNIPINGTGFVLTNAATGGTPGLGVYQDAGIIVAGKADTAPAVNIQPATITMVDSAGNQRILIQTNLGGSDQPVIGVGGADTGLGFADMFEDHTAGYLDGSTATVALPAWDLTNGSVPGGVFRLYNTTIGESFRLDGNNIAYPGGGATPPTGDGFLIVTLGGSLTKYIPFSTSPTSGAGTQTPWLGDEDAAGNSLNNILNIASYNIPINGVGYELNNFPTGGVPGLGLYGNNGMIVAASRDTPPAVNIQPANITMVNSAGTQRILLQTNFGGADQAIIGVGFTDTGRGYIDIYDSSIQGNLSTSTGSPVLPAWSLVNGGVAGGVFRLYNTTVGEAFRLDAAALTYPGGATPSASDTSLVVTIARSVTKYIPLSSTPGGGQTPWLSDIDAASHSLNNVWNITSASHTYVLSDQASGGTPGLGIYGNNGMIVAGSGDTPPAINIQPANVTMVNSAGTQRILIQSNFGGADQPIIGVGFTDTGRGYVDIYDYEIDGYLSNSQVGWRLNNHGTAGLLTLWDQSGNVNLSTDVSGDLYVRRFIGVSTNNPAVDIDTGSNTGPVKIATWQSGGNAYGIGVAPNALTFGAQINIVSGQPQMVLTSSGCLGVGTTSPGDSLVVSGMAGNAYGQIRMISGGYGCFFRNDGSNWYFMTTNSGDPNGTWKGPPYALTIDLPTNRVGIHASPNPSYGLTVDTINATSAIYINGVAVSAGGSQTPWLTDINANSHSLNNIWNITSASNTFILSDQASGGTPGLGIYGNNGIIVAGAGDAPPAINIQPANVTMVNSHGVQRILIQTNLGGADQPVIGIGFTDTNRGYVDLYDYQIVGYLPNQQQGWSLNNNGGAGLLTLHDQYGNVNLSTDNVGSLAIRGSISAGGFSTGGQTGKSGIFRIVGTDSNTYTVTFTNGIMTLVQ